VKIYRVKSFAEVAKRWRAIVCWSLLTRVMGRFVFFLSLVQFEYVFRILFCGQWSLRNFFRVDVMVDREG